MQKVIYIVVAIILLVILFKLLRVFFYVALVAIVFYFLYDFFKDKLKGFKEKRSTQNIRVK